MWIDQDVTDTESLTLRCVVNGSNPEPIVTMQAFRRILTNKDGVLRSVVEKYQFYPEGNRTVGLFKVTTNLSFFSDLSSVSVNLRDKTLCTVFQKKASKILVPLENTSVTENFLSFLCRPCTVGQ